MDGPAQLVEGILGIWVIVVEFGLRVEVIAVAIARIIVSIGSGLSTKKSSDFSVDLLINRNIMLTMWRPIPAVEFYLDRY